MNVLREIKDDSGKSLEQSNTIHSVNYIDVEQSVIIKLNLTKDYRKAKAII